MEAATRRLEGEVSTVLGGIERNHIRPIQKKAYLCSAACFDHTGFTQDALQRCVQNCQTPLQNTQNAINQEVQQFQARIQRCAAACQDDARDLMPADGNMTQALQEKAQAQMDGCVTRCVDKHIALLPGLKERLDTFCARVKDQQPQAQE